MPIILLSDCFCMGAVAKAQVQWRKEDSLSG